MSSEHHETYKGRDISIYTNDDGSCTADVKHPCGELIKGVEYITDFKTAMHFARTYVYALGDYSSAHCTNEYCLESASQ